MEVFKEAWYAIDIRAKGSISATDLERYMRKNNYEETFVQKWMAVFDQDRSGTIEIEEFCDVLGLNQKEVMAETRTRALAAGSLPEGVEYIAGDMTLEDQIDIAKLCIEAMKNQKSMKDVPKWVKHEADKRYGPVWHIVVVQGQFWCFFGYEPGKSFVFRYGKHVFITWKTHKN